MYFGAFMPVANILHVNSPKVFNLGRAESHEQEALIYVPTGTALPIVGSRMNKDIEIQSTLTSIDGSCMAIAVTTASDYHRVQLVVIDTKTGKMERFSVGSCSWLTLMHFSATNREIVYKKVDSDGNLSLVRQQIMRARQDTIANKLYGLMFGQLPIELAINISEFVIHDIDKRS